MADLPSQYAEEVETFRHILDLPDPRETMTRSSTSFLGLDDQKGQQELRPRGPSTMLLLSTHIKDAFDKFEQDSLGSNLPEGKYIKPPPSTAKWYEEQKPCFENKMQEFPNPLKPLWAKFPYQFLRNWNIRLGRISLRSTSQLLLPKLLLLVTLPWSVNTV